MVTMEGTVAALYKGKCSCTHSKVEREEGENELGFSS